MKDTVGFQLDPARNLINLITKTFNRNIFLNKNLNFVPMQKYFNKMNFFNKIYGFYQRIKLFKDQTTNNQTKHRRRYIWKTTDKTWIPKKEHHTIEIFIGATNNKINKEIAHIKPPKYSNLSKGEQEVLENLQERDERTVVIMDIADHIEEAERQITSITANYQEIKLQQTMKQPTML